MTIGGGLVGSDHQCVFPFKYNDYTYHACTNEGYHTVWCATSVNSEGVMEDDQWGHCSWSPQCLKKDSPCITQGTKGDGAGKPCVFPFKYAAIEYQTCTWVGHTALWCATEVDSDGTWTKWGECNKTDFCMSQWKTVGWAGIPEWLANKFGNQAYAQVKKVGKATTDTANSLYDNTIGRVVNFFRGIINWFTGPFSSDDASAEVKGLDPKRFAVALGRLSTTQCVWMVGT